LQWFYVLRGVLVLQLTFRDSLSFRCQICRVVRMPGVDPVMMISHPLVSHLRRRGRRSLLPGSVLEIERDMDAAIAATKVVDRAERGGRSGGLHIRDPPAHIETIEAATERGRGAHTWQSGRVAARGDRADLS
jgi:hypothetical protein